MLQTRVNPVPCVRGRNKTVCQQMTECTKEKLLEAQSVFSSFLDGKQEASAVLHTIQNLQGIPVTAESLLETKAGIPLKKLTRCSDDQIKVEASKLQTFWTDLVTSALSTPETKKTLKRKRKRSSESSTSSAPPSSQLVPPAKKLAASQNNNTTPPKAHKLPASPENEEATTRLAPPEDNAEETNQTTKPGRVPGVIPTAVAQFEASTEDKQRNLFQSKFFQALGPCLVPGGLETSLLAVEIEAELWNFAKENKKEYAAKFRTLFTNINDKENSPLREALFLGTITPQQLMLMPSEELANPKLKLERKELETWTTECRKPPKQEATCESFKCSKCKQSKTTYYQLQTRSADEPMTTFVQCVNCGNRWKFC